MSTQQPRPWRDEETLRELYLEEYMSMREIAEELGCARRTVHKWIHEHGIETRKSRQLPVEVRFWKYVDKGDPDECWEWQGKTNFNGYGGFAVENRVQINASRVAYMLEVGDPGDKLVLHKCDNPPCVNPDHLYAGTHSDNMQDHWDRSDVDMSGENNANAKLAEEDVLDIRRREGEEHPSELAEEFGITEGHVRTILSRDCWAGVEPDKTHLEDCGEVP